VTGDGVTGDTNSVASVALPKITVNGGNGCPKAGRWHGDGTLKARRKGYQRRWNRAEQGGRREANPSPPSTPHGKDYAMVDDELGPDNRSYRRMIHGPSPGGQSRVEVEGRAELPGGGEDEFPKPGVTRGSFSEGDQSTSAGEEKRSIHLLHLHLPHPP